MSPATALSRTFTNETRPFEVLAPRMSPVIYSGVAYQRRRGVLTHPSVECLLTSKFGIPRSSFNGLKHTGSDWAFPDATAILYDFPPGVVEVAADDLGGYGWGYFTVVRFTDRFGTEWLVLIAHMKYRPIVARGDQLRRGYTLGFCDSTGTATGPHIHVTIGRAADYDSGKEGIERYAEFWRSPRDDDQEVSRLWDLEAFLVDQRTFPDPIVVAEGELMEYHVFVLAATDAYFPVYEPGASARITTRYDAETGENVHELRVTPAEQALFTQRYERQQS